MLSKKEQFIRLYALYNRLDGMGVSYKAVTGSESAFILGVRDDILPVMEALKFEMELDELDDMLVIDREELQ